jgi:hypothetical protein
MPGQLIAFFRNDPKTQRDIWVASVKDRKRTFLGTAATEGAPRFSPDERWLSLIAQATSRPAALPRILKF